MTDIGLLYDSVSNNAGDIAIGRVLQRGLAQHDVPFRVIDPFQPDTRDLAALIIGGGEIIRPPGHYFYDAFRVPGRHILNTPGVIDGTHTDYLDEYRLVTARSTTDVLTLGRGTATPCLTLLYDDYLEPAPPPVHIPAGAIGIHVTHYFYNHLARFIDLLRHADLGPIVLLPVTHYNDDRLLMQVMADHIPNATLLPIMDTDDIFRTIGHLRGLITVSLHATLFAYTQRVPFLSLAHPPKISYFLAERGLEHRLFLTADDAFNQLNYLTTADDLTTITADRDRCRTTLEAIVTHAQAALTEGPTPITIPPTNRTAYDTEMTLLRTMSQTAHNLLGGLTTFLFERVPQQIESYQQHMDDQRAIIDHHEATIAQQHATIKEQQAKLAKLHPLATRYKEDILNTRAGQLLMRFRALQGRIRGQTPQPEAVPPAEQPPAPISQPEPPPLPNEPATPTPPVEQPATPTPPSEEPPAPTITFADPAYQQHIAENLPPLPPAPTDAPTIAIIPAADLMTALESTSADYIIPLAPHQTPAEDALTHLAHAITGADIVYGDYDHLTAAHQRTDPFFLPTWSPETMLSTDLFAGLIAVKRELIAQVGPPDPAFGTAARREWHLRLSEHAQRIAHVPRVLSHLAPTPPPEPDHLTAALTAHLQRRGITEPHITLQPDRTGRQLVRARWQPQHTPTVAIIIPTKDKALHLEACLQSIAQHTTYPHYEIVLVDTGSTKPATAALYQRLEANDRIRIVDYEGAFNFSRACNLGAAHTDAERLLFLNNDVLITAPGWLSRMAQWLDFPEVGLVGAQLLYPTGKIQHAGVTIGMGGFAGHLFQHMFPMEWTRFGSNSWYRTLSAVTGACVLTTRPVLQTIGGWDETYTLIFSDITLCLQVGQAGYRIAYTPDVSIIHYESQTRARQMPTNDFHQAVQGFEPLITATDPFFNPNLSTLDTTPRLRSSPDDHPLIHQKEMAARLPDTEWFNADDLWQ